MPQAESLAAGGFPSWGRLPDRPPVADPLAGIRGIPRRWADLRLKEWVGFTLVHPELFGSMIVQDAKYLTSAELYVHDRASGELHEHAASGGRGALELPRALLSGGECGFRASGFELRYGFDADAGRHTIRVDVAATADAAAVSGELVLDAAQASAPLVVNARLNEHAATMFTHKRVFAVSGMLRVGECEYRFDPARDLAILDEHRSRLPYRASWTWGTFAFRAPGGGIAGANFATRPQPAGEEEESGIWVPGAVEPLSDVTFSPEGAMPLSPWTMRSADGRLDVAFTPEGRKGVRKQFGVVAIEYFQLYGTYRGSVAGIPFDGVHGVCERMRMRS